MLERARRAALAAAVSATPIAIAGCGDDGGTVTLVDDTVVEIDTRDNAFRPETIVVPAGATVRWTNRGRNPHDVVPVEGDGWGVDAEAFEPSAVYEHRFTEPGTYPYYCSLHGTASAGMVGVIEVSE